MSFTPIASELPAIPSDALLPRLFDLSPDPISVVDLQTNRVVMLNASFARLLGHSPEQLRDQQTASLWIDPQERQRYYDRLRAERQAQDFRAVMRAADGAVRLLSINATVFEHDGRSYALSMVRDITSSEARRMQFEAILQNASVGIAFTRDRTFQHVNPRFEQLFGWSDGSLIGQPGRAVWPSDEVYESIGRIAGPLLAEGSTYEGEFEMRRRDGSTFWAGVHARAIDPQHPGSGGSIWIVDDISERRRAEQALAAARDQAEAASRAKSEFLANTSHEIRTPLNGLLGLVRLSQDPKVTPGRLREYLGRIDDSAQALAGIISDILDLSKIEAGRLTLETVPFDLHALLRGMHGAYAALAREKGLEFQLEIAPGVPDWVAGDPVRLRQVVANYISNALKFTEHGAITVRLLPLPRGGVRVQVRDSGPGIAPEVQPRLFHPFTQADASTTRRYGGTGLGLSICRQLAVLMGGGVGMQSTPGEGCTFWADLPLARSEPPRVRAADPAAVDALRGARVLLVEDNAVNRLVAEATLQQWGAEVSVAEDGAEAVRLVDTAGPYDAVLMDLHMPVMSGQDATLAIRERHGAMTLPIIALTADVLVSERDKAMHHGMNDFLAKPIDPDRLVSVLAHWVRRARHGRVAG